MTSEFDYTLATAAKTSPFTLDIRTFQNHNPLCDAPQNCCNRSNPRRTMRNLFIMLMSLMLTTVLGCKSTQNQTPINTATPVAEASIQPSASAPVAVSSPISSPATAPGKVDACTLLTSDEIKAVQGEALKTTKSSQQTGHEFVIDICYYELPTPSNSISLSLAQPNPNKKDSVREFWENTFGDSEHGRKEKEREGEGGEGELEEGAPPRKIAGLGQEAFWFASPIGGVLYVLKGDHYIRLSVGGRGTSEAKLNKSKALAKKAIARL